MRHARCDDHASFDNGRYRHLVLVSRKRAYLPKSVVKPFCWTTLNQKKRGQGRGTSESVSESEITSARIP